MKARHFIIGLLVWLALFALGARWAMNPFLWTTTGGNSMATTEQVQNAFPMRLIEVARSDILDYTARIASEEGEVQQNFSAADWCAREMQTRFIALFLLWMASGFLIHWFIGRIVRGEKSYIE